MGLATQYRALAQQYNELVDKHNQLIDRYKAVLQEKANECSLEPDKITYERFCRELRLKFAFDKMPDKSGIYAYRNTHTHDIYVGQSVNMKKRLIQHFRHVSVSLFPFLHPFSINRLNENMFRKNFPIEVPQ